MAKTDNTIPTTQIVMLDLNKVKPDPEKLARQKRNNAIIGGIVTATAGAIFGLSLGEESLADAISQGTSTQNGLIGGAAGGAIGLLAGYNFPTEDERIYKNFCGCP